MSRRSKFNRDISKIARIIAQSREYRGNGYPQDISSSPERIDNQAIIFKSERDYISSCILDYPDIETGGQLFGYWTETGVPVVMYAIGPGRNANHQKTFFNQDINYLVDVGGELRHRFGLHHIGEWHSHHKLGLARPSGHDAHTMISTIREKNLGKFLLCIGNCDERGEKSTLNPFYCDSESCTPWGWSIIGTDSPIRPVVDRSLNSILIHPAARPNHADARLNGQLGSATFPKGYWLGEEWGKKEFRSYIDYFKANYNKSLESISPKIDSNGLAHLLLAGHDHGSRIEEDILFPKSYPLASPSISITIDGRKINTSDSHWDINGQTYYSFIKFFSQSQPKIR